MKTKALIFIIIFSLFACKEDKPELEVIQAYDAIYLPMRNVTCP